MPIEVIVEDGSLVTGANSYVSVEDADTFHEQNIHGADWAGYTDDQKAKAVITASRILDQQWQWNGVKVGEDQVMQWPRGYVPDIDRTGARRRIRDALRSGFPSYDIYLASDSVPLAIIRATSMLALAIVATNREVEPGGLGIDSFSLEGVMSVSFDQTTRAPIVPEWISSELRKLGRPIIGSGYAKLIRT